MINPNMNMSNPNPIRPEPKPDPVKNPIVPRRIGEPVRTDPFMPVSMPVFHKGTSFVEKTGPAILERGEKVIPKEKNMDSLNAIQGVLGGHNIPKTPKKIKEMIHTKSHNGRHIVTHTHHHPHGSKEHDEIHSLNDMNELHQHMEDHAGTPNEGEQMSENQPPQLTPSTGPMPSPAGV
jgi:hypothetical protein